ncbi:hypothetical protein KFE25_006167 [Diacronema lutheri]|uniref:Uncharacterized protein n=2 Tax=Diacronema lutheri TaxID=2081491 RepID=A0A8J5XWC5_DIALT|nr:hypothetical protein KFE25_006167 [Diacronema lutheri]
MKAGLARLVFTLAVLEQAGASTVGAPGQSPPIGAVYERTLSLPVIGSQTVRIGIISARMATLQLSGALKLDELLSYFPDESGRGLAFVLGARTTALLRRLGVGLQSAEWSPREDVAFVTVAPPFVRPVVLRLERLPDS